MNNTQYICAGCGIDVPCILVMFNKVDKEQPDTFNGYCQFDSTPARWYKNET